MKGSKLFEEDISEAFAHRLKEAVRHYENHPVAKEVLDFIVQESKRPLSHLKGR